MSAGITFVCDAKRHGDSCRGFLPTQRQDVHDAWHFEAEPRGWRFARIPGVGLGDVCPSWNHDGVSDDISDPAIIAPFVPKEPRE